MIRHSLSPALLAILLLVACPPPTDDDDSSTADDDDDDSAPTAGAVYDAFTLVDGGHTLECSELTGPGDPAGTLTIGQLYGITVSLEDLRIDIGSNTGLLSFAWDEADGDSIVGSPEEGQVQILIVDSEGSGAGITWNEAFGGVTRASLTLPGGSTYVLRPPGI